MQFEEALTRWTAALNVQQDKDVKFNVLVGRSQCYIGADPVSVAVPVAAPSLAPPLRWPGATAVWWICVRGTHLMLRAPRLWAASLDSRDSIKYAKHASARFMRMWCRRHHVCGSDIERAHLADYSCYLRAIPAAASERSARYALEPQQIAKLGLADADRARQLASERPAAHLCRGQTLALLEDYGGAEDAFLLALSLDAECDQAKVCPLRYPIGAPRLALR
jgi:hypothetical protein